jgi:Uma2 family endonuclease
MPILFGEEDLEMGESDLHTRTTDILVYGMEFHLSNQPALRVFSNLNLYYTALEPEAYVSPDGMVVKPRRRLPANPTSYQIGKDGPAPLCVAEVLSFRTYQQGDLSHKPIVYADLAIPEYLLIDVSGEMLREKLLRLELLANGHWKTERDSDGGITSSLGFRLVIEPDGQLRVLNAQTGEAYARPREAQAALDEKRRALDALRELQAEVDRLRSERGQQQSEKKRRRRP